jgi:hypothetical protein
MMPSKAPGGYLRPFRSGLPGTKNNMLAVEHFIIHDLKGQVFKIETSYLT